MAVEVPFQDIFPEAKSDGYFTVTGNYVPFIRETRFEPSEGGYFDEITSIKINDEIEIIDLSDKLEIGSKILYDVIERAASYVAEDTIYEN